MRIECKSVIVRLVANRIDQALLDFHLVCSREILNAMDNILNTANRAVTAAVEALTPSNSFEINFNGSSK